MIITSSCFQVFGDYYGQARESMGRRKDKELYNLHHPCPPNTVSLGSLGHLLVTSGSDCLIRLYDLRRVGNEDGGSVQNYNRIIDYFVTPSPFVEKPTTRYTVRVAQFSGLHHCMG